MLKNLFTAHMNKKSVVSCAKRAGTMTLCLFVLCAAEGCSETTISAKRYYSEVLHEDIKEKLKPTFVILAPKKQKHARHYARYKKLITQNLKSLRFVPYHPLKSDELDNDEKEYQEDTGPDYAVLFVIGKEKGAKNITFPSFENSEENSDKNYESGDDSENESDYEDESVRVYGNSVHYDGSIYFTPEYKITDKDVDEQEDEYTNYFIIKMDDLKTEDADDTMALVGGAFNVGTSSLTKVAGCLINGFFNKFPGKDGETIHLQLSSSDCKD